MVKHFLGLEERVLREKLAKAHHIIRHHHWDDLLSAHLSARIPNTHYILVTPLNTAFEAVTADNLVKMNYLTGEVESVSASSQIVRIVMPQAANIHLEIYRTSDKVHAVLHTHSLNALSVACMECGFLFFHQHALRFYDEIAYHDYHGLALENEGKEIAKSLENKKIMLLRNHGLIVAEESIEAAIHALYYFEISCEIQLKTLAAQKPLNIISEEICRKTKKQFDSIRTPEKEFEALVQRLNLF